MQPSPDSLNQAFLALGGNLGDRVATLSNARNAVANIIGCTLTGTSSLYQSPAWGTTDAQPYYLNAVIALTTSLTAIELWHAASAIESQLGRVRTSYQNAARTLDIDLLLFGTTVLNTPELTLPHPRMHLRKFVLLPLLEIAPTALIPGIGCAFDSLCALADVNPHKLGHNSAWN